MSAVSSTTSCSLDGALSPCVEVAQAVDASLVIESEGALPAAESRRSWVVPIIVAISCCSSAIGTVQLLDNAADAWQLRAALNEAIAAVNGGTFEQLSVVSIKQVGLGETRQERNRLAEELHRHAGEVDNYEILSVESYSRDDTPNVHVIAVLDGRRQKIRMAAIYQKVLGDWQLDRMILSK